MPLIAWQEGLLICFKNRTKPKAEANACFAKRVEGHLLSGDFCFSLWLLSLEIHVPYFFSFYALV